MTGFYCEACGASTDEVEHNLFDGAHICDSCFVIAKEDEEISEEAKMKGLEPLKEYLDLFGGSME